MNKLGHLMITERFVDSIPKHHLFFLKIGCILPDILLHTYLVGHTWTASLPKIHKKMKALENKGTFNIFSFLSLGYILHYIEDYFTYPHNLWYTGNFFNHIQYEKEFSSHIHSHQNIENQLDSKYAMSTDVLIDYLKKSHERYEANTAGFENDLYHISDAVQKTAYSYLLILQKNQQLTENTLLPDSLDYPIADYPVLHK